MQKAQDAIDKEEAQQNKLREQIRERKETTLDRLVQIKRLNMEKGKILLIRYIHLYIKVYSILLSYDLVVEKQTP